MRLCQPTILDRLLDWAKRLWMSAPTEGALSPTSLLPPNRWLIEGTRSCSRYVGLWRAAPNRCSRIDPAWPPGTYRFPARTAHRIGHSAEIGRASCRERV